MAIIKLPAGAQKFILLLSSANTGKRKPGEVSKTCLPRWLREFFTLIFQGSLGEGTSILFCFFFWTYQIYKGIYSFPDPALSCLLPLICATVVENAGCPCDLLWGPLLSPFSSHCPLLWGIHRWYRNKNGDRKKEKYREMYIINGWTIFQTSLLLLNVPLCS